MIWALLFSLFLNTNPGYAGDREVIDAVHTGFDVCLRSLYFSHGASWTDAQSKCTAAFNKKFERRNISFQIVRGHLNGPNSYFVELEIRKSGVATRRMLAGGGAPNCNDARSSSGELVNIARELRYKTTTCEPTKTKGAGAKPGLNEYGYGFSETVSGCQRICPKGTFFTEVDRVGKCVSCPNSDAVVTFSIWASQDLAAGFDQTDEKTNACLDGNGCPFGKQYGGKRRDGSAICKDLCRLSAKRGDKDWCESSDHFCERGQDIVTRDVDWSSFDLIPSRQLGKCSAAVVKAQAARFRQDYTRQLQRFTALCEARVRGEFNRFTTFPQVLMEKCELKAEELSFNLPSTPVFRTMEAVQLMNFLID